MPIETLDVTTMLPNDFEPKKKNRFILMIEGIDAFIVKTAARPQMQTAEIEIGWMNSTRYIAGKTTFQPFSVTLHAPIAPSGVQQVMEWVRMHFECISGRAGYADFYKRDIQLKMVDPIGTVIELWDLKGCFLTDVNFGDLDTASGDLTEIALTIRYDLAALQF